MHEWWPPYSCHGCPIRRKAKAEAEERERGLSKPGDAGDGGLGTTRNASMEEGPPPEPTWRGAPGGWDSEGDPTRLPPTFLIGRGLYLPGSVASGGAGGGEDSAVSTQVYGALRGLAASADSQGATTDWGGSGASRGGSGSGSGQGDGEDGWRGAWRGARGRLVSRRGCRRRSRSQLPRPCPAGAAWGGSGREEAPKAATTARGAGGPSSLPPTVVLGPWGAKPGDLGAGELAAGEPGRAGPAGQPWQGPGLWAGLAPGDGLGRWMQSQSQSQGQGQTRSQPPPMPRGWGSRPDDGGAGNEPLINQLEVRGRSTSDGCMPGGS